MKINHRRKNPGSQSSPRRDNIPCDSDGLRHEARKERRNTDARALRDLLVNGDDSQAVLSLSRTGNRWHWD